MALLYSPDMKKSGGKMCGMPSVLERDEAISCRHLPGPGFVRRLWQEPAAPSTATTDTSSTNLFQGTLDTGGIAVQSFNAAAAQTVKLMLASVSAEANRPLAQPLVLAVGTLSGSDCTASTTVRATPALTGQLSSNVAAGSFCVSVSDPESQIVGTVTFSLRVVIGSPTPEDVGRERHMGDRSQHERFGLAHGVGLGCRDYDDHSRFYFVHGRPVRTRTRYPRQRSQWLRVDADDDRRHGRQGDRIGGVR